MTQNKLIPFVVAGAVLTIGFVFYAARSNVSTTYKPTNTTETPTAAPTPEVSPTGVPVPTPSGPTTYTIAQVTKHNNRTDCWTAINGGVYNVTSWIAQHPGGQSTIISLCGIDGSAAFDDQHGGQGRPESELASFKIGTLK